MSRLLSAVLFAGLALGSDVLAANAEGPIRLRFDPFAQPGAPAAGPGSGPARSQRAWSPELRATLVSGERSLVNLGGTILGTSNRGDPFAFPDPGPGGET